MNPIQREKLYEALAFFHSNVRNPGHIKLLKLVYYLDLAHFRMTGRTVTGLRYEAWPFGPVPPTVWAELQSPDSDIRQRFEVSAARQVEHDSDIPTIDSDEDSVTAQGPTVGWVPGQLRPLAPFKHRFLSRKELGIADRLVEIFARAKASDMSEASHQRLGPWWNAWRRRSDDSRAFPEIDLRDGEVGLGRTDDYLDDDTLREAIREAEQTNRILM